MNRFVSPRGRQIAVYCGMLAASVVLFLLIDRFGSGLVAPPPGEVVAGGAREQADGAFWHVLLALAVVVVVGRVLGRAFGAIGQPPVIAEVVAGIVLGPSLLGALAPDAASFLLPPSIQPMLEMLAQLGVVIYMFVVGIELDTGQLRTQIGTSVMTSHAGIAVPFTLGAALALFLYPRFSSNDVSFTHFALFLGVALSITAFPVLARILSDRRLTGTPLGALALTCAAIGDVTAWCLLAFVVGIVQDAGGHAALVGVWTALFVAAMVLVARPAFDRLSNSVARGGRADGPVAVTLVAALTAALATESIGVHAIFGPFLLGAIIRHDSPLARALTTAIGSLVHVLLLPAFFVLTGLRTQVALVSGGYEWLVCALIVVVATLSKFGSTAVAARGAGLDWRDATALGVLMNTRGLMELIVLNVGLELGVISPTLFTMLVLMALVTTMITAPLLQLVVPAPAAASAASRVAPEARA